MDETLSNDYCLIREKLEINIILDLFSKSPYFKIQSQIFLAFV